MSRLEQEQVEAKARDKELLEYLPDAIKRLQGWIGERKWNGELVTANHYEQLQRWRSMVQAGQMYEARF